MGTQSNLLKDLKIQYENTDSLVPYINNANIHSEEQIEQIAASIREFGFNDPVAVWTNGDGKSELVAGHGRILAAKKLGLETVPVIHLDTLTDEQRRAYTHVHNQQTRNSEFDWELLDMEMAELDFDWGDLGFSDIEIINNTIDYSEDDKLDRYDEYAEEAMAELNFSIIISCQNEEEKRQIAEILGLDTSKIRRLYSAKEILDV